MDLEMENRIAAILMKEAAELQLQAEKEGIHAYLQPNVRGRPNSRFLTATVRGVQQANRAAEVNEMWRVRQKELELDDRLKGRSRDKCSSSSSHRDHSDAPKSTSTRCRETDKDAVTSRKRASEDCYTSEDGGLRDEEVEQFLHSRLYMVKRGRGAIGSRMNETGPYLPQSVSQEKLFANSDVRVREEWESHVLRPEKPYSLKLRKSSEDELDLDSWKKVKKGDSASSKKWHSKEHRSKDKSRHKKKEKKSKHRHTR